MPVYHVKTPSGEHLVDATTKAAAINHIIRNSVTADPLKSSDLVKLMQKGLTVETASADALQPHA
jgi:hypothetical protein